MEDMTGGLCRLAKLAMWPASHNKYPTLFSRYKTHIICSNAFGISILIQAQYQSQTERLVKLSSI